MKHTWAMLLTITAALLLPAGAAHAAKTFIVFPIQTTETYEHDARVMSRLLRNEIDAQDDTKVLGTQGKSCNSLSAAKKIRRARDVDAVVIGELTTLGGELQLLVDAVWDDDVFHYSEQLESTGEFTKIVGRLAKAIRDRKSYESARGVDSVSEAEMYPYKNKVHGMWKLGFALGMIAPLSDTYLGADYLVGILPRFRYEIAQIAIEGETGYYYADQTAAGYSLGAIPLEISVHYYLMNADISPFLGATFGAHLLFTNPRTEEKQSSVYTNETSSSFEYDDTYWLFSIGAYAGIELLRTHTFNVNLRAGYRYGFVDFGDALIGTDATNGAHGVFVQIGVTFDLPTASYKKHHHDRYYRYRRPSHYRRY
ncbi:MAG: hypothetical protein P9L99_04135 [Candidatus Lernaella stagnicola]|nr:hypothetical protein [Candidatus Lernaella stagnicola]